MSFKWFGALLIIIACGAVGFGMAAAYNREERMLRQLIGVLDYMSCELHYHLTPLPALLSQAAKECSGTVGAVLTKLAKRLNEQVMPDVSACMKDALDGSCVSGRIREEFELLGSTLGRFDLEGQQRGLESVRNHCRREADKLSSGREARLRSYQTLGLCAGAALAILLV